MKIQQSLKDRRKIEHMMLDNEMKVLLVEDKECDKSSVALSINIGSIQDYKEVQGIAHFLEHMMYLGSEKYPGQHAFSDFLTNNGSEMDNAFTCDNCTVYYYDIPNNYLEKSLDMFGAIFSGPLLSEDGVEREKNAVQSEYTQSLQNDAFRIEQLIKHLAQKDHPFSQFTMGSLKSFDHKDLYKLVQQFYQQYYSANLMNLVVYSKKGIEETREMVKRYFSGVVNKAVKWEKYQNPYQQQHLMKFIRMQPIKDKDTIQISWNIEHLLDNYKKSAGLVLSYIFGLENKDSLYQMLLDDHLVTSLSSGFTDHINTFSEFNVKIQLTQKGLQEYPRVLEGLFSYLKMLKIKGVDQWLIEQIQQIQQIDFDYSCKQQPLDFVLQLAENLIYYKIEDVVCGGQLVHELDVEFVNRILNQLQLNNMNICLVSKSNKSDDLDLYYEDYQLKYSVEQFSEQIEQLYKNPNYQKSKNKQIDVCGPNQFIVKNVEQLENKSPEKQIELVHEEQGNRIWFKQDNQFRCSVINVSMLVYFESDIDDLGQMTGRSIFFEMFKKLVNEELYDADQVGYKINLQHRQEHIYFSVQGFAEHFGKIWKYLFRKLFELKGMALQGDSYVCERFETTRYKIQSDISNSLKTQPHSIARNMLKYLMIKGGDHCIIQSLELIKKYQFCDFVDSCKEFLNKVHIDWLVVGNVDKQISLELKNEIKHILEANKVQQLQLSDVKPKNVMKLDNRYVYQFDLMDKLQNENLNSCYVMYIQSGLKETEKVKLLYTFLSQFLAQWFFDQLRTEQQLGYNCFCFNQEFRGRCGNVFLIQSDVQDSNYLAERVDEFIKESYQDIVEMSEDEFMEIKEGVQAIVSQNYNNILEESGVEFDEIIKRQYLFNRKVRSSELVEDIRLEDIVKLYRENILENNNRIELHLISNAHKQKYYGSKKDGDTIIKDVQQFKQKLGVYEDCYHPTSNNC